MLSHLDKLFEIVAMERLFHKFQIILFRHINDFNGEARRLRLVDITAQFDVTPDGLPYQPGPRNVESHIAAPL
jgi:hypothetical protein